MFWGREQKENLQQLIFGNPGTTLPASRTLINSLYNNMLTLSADTHIYWALGTFILEPLEERSDSHELRARIRYMPRRFENPKELGIDVDPTNIEIIPPQDSDRLVDSVTNVTNHGWAHHYIQNKMIQSTPPFRAGTC